jgi:NDP-sugar pyrophosphorylase family protein
VDAIILAGGKGTRMHPLTASVPKPLLVVQGKPILEWSLLSLATVADHIIVVTSYLKEQIAEYMARQNITRNYTLVEQKPTPLGTGHALQCCQPYLRSYEFLTINGDDLYDPLSLGELASQRLGILGAYREQASKWGVLVMSEKQFLQRIHEKPPEGLYAPPVAVNAGAYKLDRRIFDFQLPLSVRNEYEITDYLTFLAHSNDIKVVVAPFWYGIGTPSDLQQAQSLTIPTSAKL